MSETWISVIKSEYESRFQTLKKHREMFAFILKLDEIEESFINLQYFEYLKIDNFSLEIIDFNSSTLTSIPPGFSLLSYKCELIFSQIKFILCKNRSRLTIENSVACI